MNRRVRMLSWVLPAALAAWGCEGQRPPAAPSPTSGTAGAKIVIGSDAFKDGQPIPRRHTADGENLSPPLSWSNVPPQTKELALIADDPDAPSGVWVHWVIYRIAPTVSSLPEGASSSAKKNTPEGTLAGRNSFRDLGYGGPSPPPGKPHRYVFRLYALDAPLDLPAGADKAALLRAMEGHILAQGVLTGTYQR